jgi:hypothetical protein
VRFADDSVEQVDAIVFATGYKISFPFFDDPALLPDADHRFPLFKRMMKPGVPNLFFMGLAQPLPTLVNFAEQQAKLAAGYLAGTYAPPPAAEMVRIIAKDDERHRGSSTPRRGTRSKSTSTSTARISRRRSPRARRGRGRRETGAGAGGDQDGAVAGR